MFVELFFKLFVFLNSKCQILQQKCSKIAKSSTFVSNFGINNFVAKTFKQTTFMSIAFVNTKRKKNVKHVDVEDTAKGGTRH